jgi:hypothetical protein
MTIAELRAAIAAAADLEPRADDAKVAGPSSVQPINLPVKSDKQA